MDAGIVPRLIAVDEHARPPGFLADLQPPALALDHHGPPAVEGHRRVAVIVELALDDDPALVRDQAGGGQRRARLPVEREGVRMRQWVRRTRIPRPVELHGAGGALNHRAVGNEEGKGAGPLVGEWR